jgi:thiazole synthase
MARELFETKLIKLEVIGDEASFQPDPFGLVQAATELVRLGFQVLPYCTEDWILCRRLLDAGCEVLTPWAAPIGTGQGPCNPAACANYGKVHRTLLSSSMPALVCLPHACQVMEWGFDGVLLNTAISRAIDPVLMAGAFSASVQAGRISCRLNGRTDISRAEHAGHRPALSNRTSPLSKRSIRGIRLHTLLRKSRAIDYFNWRMESLVN